MDREILRTMSQDNVELARRSLEAFAAGDWRTTLEFVDPEVEWIETPGLGPDAAVYRGIEEIRDAVESWTEMWTDYAFEVCDYLDAGDQVVVLMKEGGRGRGTGVSVERELGQVFTVRGGKVRRVRLYGNWAEALEAAGLGE
jgi:ketosteroid isomerase-like protein